MPLITTTKGPMEARIVDCTHCGLPLSAAHALTDPGAESLLEVKVQTIDNDNEMTHAVEYYLDGELVHRSAHVHLKQGLAALAAVQGF